MSVRVMTAVWGIDLADSEKLVLLALADCANDEGHCWPSMASLAKKCSKSDRTVQKAIQALVSAGHLTRNEVAGKGCNYTVHPRSEAASDGEAHYLYRTENVDTGEFYVGARSFYGDPAGDNYVGSGAWIKAVMGKVPLKKTVLGTYPTREALAVAEEAATAAVFGDPLCRNRKVATPETLSPRNRFAPKRRTLTPEAASDKPSRTVNSSVAKATSPRDHSRSQWREPPVPVPSQVWADLRTNRKRKRLPETPTAYAKLIADLARIAPKAGMSEAELLTECVARGWAGIYDPKARSERQQTGPPSFMEQYRTELKQAN